MNDRLAFGARPIPARLVTAVMLLCAVLYVATSIIGGIRGYTPVPYWDMWDGYLGFFMRLESGDWSSWWAQHNEHRIILGRLLYWVDLRLFHGSVVFLLIANYVLVGLGTLLFASIARAALPNPQHAVLRRIAMLLAVCLMFSWAQYENLTSGFQGPFLLAQLIPLAALYALYRYRATGMRGNGWFVAAALLGFASIGTMANGVLVLPLLVVLALFFKVDRSRVGILAALAAVAVALYFFNYEPVARHGPVVKTAMVQPLLVLQYLVLYLGGPFAFLAQGRWLGAVEATGGVFLLGTLFLVVKIARNPGPNALPAMLLAFIVYVVATASVTGAGRLVFGVLQALSSRYSTPALMAWCALLLALMQISSRSAPARSAMGAAALLVTLLLLPFQVGTVFAHPLSFERWAGVLPLELGVRDFEPVVKIAPAEVEVFKLADFARQRGLSAFADPLLKGARESIGPRQLPELPGAERCVGKVDTVARIDSDDRYLVVSGWIHTADSGAVPRVVLFVDPSRRVVGYGLSGARRCDIAEAQGLREIRRLQGTEGWRDTSCNVGFKGYLLASVAGAPISLAGEQPDCR